MGSCARSCPGGSIRFVERLRIPKPRSVLTALGIVGRVDRGRSSSSRFPLTTLKWWLWWVILYHLVHDGPSIGEKETPATRPEAARLIPETRIRSGRRFTVIPGNRSVFHPIFGRNHAAGRSE